MMIKLSRLSVIQRAPCTISCQLRWLSQSSPKDFMKKKVSLVYGFVGSRYYGLQYNGDSPTIEREILKALNLAGYIADSNALAPNKVSLSRSSRTDKGVHAARTVMCLKLNIPKTELGIPLTCSAFGPHSTQSVVNTTETDLTALVLKVNKFLPPDIQVFSALCMNAAFNAKSNCGWRMYEYLLPVDMLMVPPSKYTSGELVPFDEHSWDEDSIQKSCEKLQRVLSLMEGTYNFEKFARQQKKTRTDKFVTNARSHELIEETDVDVTKQGGDSRSPRQKIKTARGTGTSTVYSLRINTNIVSLTPGEEVYGPIHIPTHLFDSQYSDAVAVNRSVLAPRRQYIRISIVGKFFLFNQIRIMLGSALAVYHGVLPQNSIENALKLWESSQEVSAKPLPIIPAEGLICLDCGFDRNKSGKNYVTNNDIVQREMELFANENGEYVEFCDDVGMKARIDQYYPISKHDAFANSEVFKMNAIYRTIGSLYTTKVVQNWFAYLEKYYGIESPFAIREEIEATSIKTVSNGQRAQGDMVEWSIPPSGRSWNTALLASIEAFRVHYLSKSTASDITNVNEEHLYVLKHDRRYSSRNNAKVQRGKPSELLEFAPYHPIKLFVPKHLASTMSTYFQLLPGSVIVSEAMRAVATDTLKIESTELFRIVSTTENAYAASNAICKHIEAAGGILHWAKYMPKDNRIQ